ncbi:MULTISPECIES: DUF4391 domain-containing protein [unclassified Rathayibacter]|uniref:DUF4391 domain-containing protein n=1 Tax=unclassified Rathayibacter TaxID=2609250 RepID=UPI0015E2B869|nr:MULTISPECIES: DUF4391 domain-containing protein [unclassified Rathayibacter]
MSSTPVDLAELLGLPVRARETHRVTKKDIVAQWEQSAPSDARLLGRTISSAAIVGVLSPTTIGAAAVVSEDVRVDMIPVLSVVLAEHVRPADRRRVAELLHRSMPRPAVIGLQASDDHSVLSLALTRLSRIDVGMSVIEAHLLVPVAAIAAHALEISNLARTNLVMMYGDLVRTAAADGRPASPALSPVNAVELRRRVGVLEGELATAIRDAAREKAMQKRISLNVRARELRARIADIATELYGENGNAREGASGDVPPAMETKVGP